MHPINCNHCDRLTFWPRWARYEHLDYHPLCWSCFERLDATFTAEMAIMHALIIVGVHQGAMGVQR